MFPRVPSLLPILLVAACMSFPAPVARAAWPHDPNNGNVALCTAAGSQVSPTIVPDGAGGAIVTWYDFRSGSGNDIYAQRVSAAGVPQWTGDGVALCTATGHQYLPTIAPDGAGGAIVTWYDFRGGSQSDVYVQRVSAAGVPQWTADGVALCTAIRDQVFPTIVPDGTGGAIVTWSDTRSGTNADVYAQRVSAAGVPQWTADGVALSTAVGNQGFPTIVSDGTGGAIVSWHDERSGTSWDIYARRVSAAGVPQWTADGVALCTAAGDQTYPTIVTDGTGGAIVAWRDFRSGSNLDVYARRVSAAGVPQWTADGVALSTAASDQNAPTLASDGGGGAIVTWLDFRSGSNWDIYAQRVSAAGMPDWTSSGVALCTAAGDQSSPTLAPDGAGGAIVTWYDYRSGTNADVYAQRVSAAGVLQWAANGVALSTAAGDQLAPVIVSDGTGGGIVTWYDYRSGNNDIYAQRVERFGQTGNPEPVIAEVHDVPNDEGGRVKVSWSASYLDVDPIYGIHEYRLWRSAPPQASLSSAPAAGGMTGDPDEAAATGRWLAMPFAGTDYAWELVATQTAAILPDYSLVAATTGDSIGGSNPLTIFMVEARAGSALSSPRWFSAPDSGYSVDNLAPVTPSPFAGTYSSGTAALHWGASPEIDFAVYRIYRGSSPGFVPGPGNLIATSPDTGYADVAAAPYHYKLSAVDIHGNESGFALYSAPGAVDVPGGDAPLELRLGGPEPNPAWDVARIALALPQATAISLVVHDPSGRAVRMLYRGVHAAGRFTVSWDLRDDHGHAVASGVYFLRLEAAGRSLTRRVVAMR